MTSSPWDNVLASQQTLTLQFPPKGSVNYVFNDASNWVQYLGMFGRSYPFITPVKTFWKYLKVLSVHTRVVGMRRKETSMNPICAFRLRSHDTWNEVLGGSSTSQKSIGGKHTGGVMKSSGKCAQVAVLGAIDSYAEIHPVIIVHPVRCTAILILQSLGRSGANS